MKEIKVIFSCLIMIWLACCGSNHVPNCAVDVPSIDRIAEDSLGSQDVQTEEPVVAIDVADSPSNDSTEQSICNAIQLNPGDLVRCECHPATFYIGDDCKKHLFPNEVTYSTWFDDNFASVQEISAEWSNRIENGDVVRIRSGTKLIKITTDPRTFAVTPDGVLHWVQSEAIAANLYGPDWRLRIIDLADGFFPFYSIGDPISTSIHPDGALIRYAEAPEVIYLIENGLRRPLESGAFEANNLSRQWIITTAIVYPDGEQITGRIPLYTAPY